MEWNNYTLQTRINYNTFNNDFEVNNHLRQRLVV